MKTRALVVLGIFVVALVTACSLIPCVERQHESGLLLVCSESLEKLTDMPEELKAAASFAWNVAEDNPDDLGYPWANPDTKQLELRITGARGEAVAREWIAGNAKRTGAGKTMDLPRPQVPVKFVAVNRSFRLLTEIQHGSIPATDLPDGDAIYTTGPDTRRNATVITVDRLSGALLRALATRYGTDAIVIRVDPNRPRVGY